MGRRQINYEQRLARFPAGTLKKIDALLEQGEKWADFIRAVVFAELKRRKRRMGKQ